MALNGHESSQFPMSNLPALHGTRNLQSNWTFLEDGQLRLVELVNLQKVYSAPEGLERGGEEIGR